MAMPSSSQAERTSSMVEQKMCPTRMAAVDFSTEINQNKFLIVGLGNYGYPETRHNIGMMFVDWLANQLSITWTNEKKRCNGYITSCLLQDDIQLVLLKPREPMNLSGHSVYKTAHQYKIPTANVFIIQDDLEKPIGKIIIKTGGSARGHNGVKSVINSLRTDAFTRMKLGIDRPVSKDPGVVGEYVLDRFTTEQRDKIDEVLPAAINSLEKHLALISGVDINLGGKIT